MRNLWLLRRATVACAIVFASVSAFAADKSGVRPTVLSVPRGPGSVEGLGESFQVNLNSGSATESIALKVPPGTGGMTPGVALSYDSGHGNGPLGIGWTLNLPTIQRQTDKGLPRYVSADRLTFQGAKLAEVSADTYRLQVEGRFVRVRRSGAGFEVDLPNGTTQRYGTTSDSRVEQGASVFAWYLDDEIDPQGNRISSFYEKEGGLPWLSRIEYNRRPGAARNVIEFNWEQRPDQLSDNRPGFRTVATRRLSRIVVSANGEFLRRYELTYGPGTGLSRLATVVMLGSDGATSLPAIQFGWSDFAPQNRAPTPLASAPADLPGASPDTELSDVDGDGFPDVLTAALGQHRWSRNLAGHGFAPPTTIAAPPSVNLGTAGVELADLNGDGIADLVARTGSTAAAFRYFPATGSGNWAPAVTFSGNPSFPVEDGTTRFVDLDLDHLPDVMRLTATEASWWRNNGDGSWAPPQTLPLPTGGTVLEFADQRVKLADLNGDHLLDLVFVRTGSVTCWLGLGRGQFEAPITWSGAPNVGALNEGRLQLADVSGDGLADLLLVDVDHVDLWLATPQQTFAAPISFANTPSANPTLTQVRLADMNGNGSVDVVWFTPSAAPNERVVVLDVQEGVRPNLLVSVKNGLGLERELLWTTSGHQYDEALAKGLPWRTRLPFPVQVIASAVLSDSRGLRATSTYSYSDGYFDGPTREFRGFAHVVERFEGDVDEPTLLVSHDYDLGQLAKCRQGKELATDRRDVSGSLFDRGEFDYRVHTVATALSGQPLQFAELSEERRFEHDGTSTPLETLQQWNYDDWGNAVHAFQAGRVEGSNLLAGNDETATERVFINDSTRWLIGLLQEERVTDASGAIASRVRRYFDGPPLVGLPLGQATAGLVTREERWRTADQWVQTARTERDAFGNVVVTLSPLGGRREITWDAETHTRPVGEKAWANESSSLEWSLAYQGQSDLVASYTDANGAVTRFAYDPLGRLVGVAKPGDTLERPTLAWAWAVASPLSTLTTIVRHGPGQDDVTRSFNVVDGLGRTLAVIHQAEGGRWVVGARQQFSARGSVVKQWDAFFADTSAFVAEPTTAAVRKQYDPLGRITAAYFVDGTRTELHYGPSWKEAWDGEDLRPDSPHANTPQRSELDGQGRVVAAVESLGHETLTTRFTYDAASRCTGYTTQTGMKVEYAFDGLGRLLSVRHPDIGFRQYEYDDDGNMKTWKDAMGQQLTFEFDRLGRTTAEKMLDSSGHQVGLIEYHFDTPSPRFPSDGLSAGNLTWVSDAAGEEHFRYDERRRMVEDLRQLDGREFHLGHAYDSADRVTSLTYPDGATVEYQYNVRGFVAAIPGFLREMEYDAGGMATRRVYANGVVSTAQYDAHERVAALGARDGSGKAAQSLGFAYDAAGTLLRLTDEVAPAGSASATWAFEYDDLYRLVTARGPAKTLGHQYDVLGNLLQKSDLGAYAYPAPGAAHPNTVRAVGGRVLEWDGNGALSRFENRTYTWNPGGQLSRVTTERGISDYLYDYTGQRAVKTVTALGKNEKTLYIDKFAEERGGKLIKYVFVGDTRLARIGGGLPKVVEVATAAIGPGAAGLGLLALGLSVALSLLRKRRAASRAIAAVVLLAFTSCNCGPQSGAPSDAVFYVDDHLGSATLVFDAQGKQVAASNFDAWGSALEGTDEPYGFLGTEYDPEAGLQFLGSRYYDPRLGRFISPDLSIVGNAGLGVQDPQQLNLYSYARNTPTSLRDKTGKLPHILAGALIGAVVGLAVYSARAAINGEQMTVRGALGATVGGAVAGAVGAATLGAGLILGGMATGVAGGLTERAITTGDAAKTFDPDTMATDALVGAAGAVAGKALSVVGTKVVGAVKGRFGAAVSEGLETGKAGCAGGRCERGGGCFVEGTPVAMADGSTKPIEFVQPGEWVVAPSDQGQGPLVSARVARRIERDVAEVVDVAFATPDGSNELVTTTFEHPFLVDVDGLREWVPAGELQPSALLVGMHTSPRVLGLRTRSEQTHVYNLEIEDAHAFAVGAVGAQVHNTECGGKPASAPHSTDAPAVTPKASRPGKMQMEVERGQAPREVERVDKPHIADQEAHVHFCDGTACNQSGTTHDAFKGDPTPSKATREWLTSHGWTPPPSSNR